MNKIKNVEFYITNVCNFSCKGCVSYNNFKFTGHQIWSEQQSMYEQWATQLDIERIDILGGEPMLNPSLIDWMYGLRKLWPNTEINIVSNGSQLLKVKDLYQAMKDNNIAVDITMHSHRKMTPSEITGKKIIIRSPDDIHSTIKTFYKDDTLVPETMEHVTPILGNERMSITTYTDSNYVKIRIKDNIEFLEIAGLQISDTGNFKIEEQSVPAEAFAPCIDLCDFHPIINGKIYQCKFVALAPDIVKQRGQPVANIEHIESYQPLTLDSDNKDEFINSLDTRCIEQCRFCPKDYKLI